ncbi:MAG: glycosyltransferase [Phycisphaerales bacterium JB039]
MAETAGSMAIGVCTYNRGKRIVEALEALTGLDTAGGRLRRIIVIENNCSDETPEAVEAFAQSGPPVAVELWHEPAPGKSEALRRYFTGAVEDVLGLVDDDVLVEADWASRALDALDANERAGAVGGQVECRWESGPTPMAIKYRQSFGEQRRGEAPLALDRPVDFLVGAAVAYRRRAIHDSGWLDRGRLTTTRTGGAMLTGEDVELCVRMARAGWALRYEPAMRATHLIPARRQSRAYIARHREAICRAFPMLEWLAAGEPGADWARPELRRARRRWMKSVLTDWRPRRRAIRLGERRGRLAGWRDVMEAIAARSA